MNKKMVQIVLVAAFFIVFGYVSYILTGSLPTLY